MKRVVIFIFILIVGAIIAYLYVFHKPHRNLLEEDARHEVPSELLRSDFIKDERAANTKYLDHIILVGGEVLSVDSSSITLAPGIYCHMHKEESTQGIQIGDHLDIKGRVVGYDELFEEVKMDFCSLVE